MTRTNTFTIPQATTSNPSPAFRRGRRGAGRALPTALARAAAAAAAAALLVACGNGHRAQAARPSVPVTVAKVVEKTVPVTFRAIGHVEAISTVAVRARIGGDLQRIGFAEGQVVHAGQTLFTIDPRQYEAALRQAEAQLARDRAQLQQADKDIERYAGLVKQDFVTKEQYDQFVTTAASQRATVEADQASVDNARLQLAYCTIVSPVEGRTGNLMVKEGNLIKANDDKLVTINQMRPIYVSFSVPAQYLPAIRRRPLDAIRVLASVPDGGAAPADGALSFIDNAVDTTTSTILLKATFANADEVLWPGQFVDVTVTLGEEAGRVVAPAPAVQTGQQGQYVYVVKGDSTVELRPVKVDRMDETEAVIASGLAAGETVVTDGQLRLVPGARIEVKGAAAPGAKGA